MGIDKLDFDFSLGDLSENDNVGAFLRTSGGDLVTGQDLGGDHHANVAARLIDENGTEYSDANPLPVDIGAASINVDIDHTEDSVRLGDGTSFLTSTSENGDISLDVHVSNSNIEVTQGTSPWVIGDGGGSITVDAVDLDIRDLNSASDSVAAVQSGAWDVGISSWSAGEIEVKDTADSAQFITAAITPVATQLSTSALAGRREIVIENLGSNACEVGLSGVTFGSGFRVSKGSVLTLKASDSVDLYAICDAGKASDLRIIELA